MIDWLNDNSGAVQGVAAIASILVLVVLVLVTRYYARETERIAKATDEQAKVGSEMAREMSLSRQDESRPVLDLHKIPQDAFGTGPEAMQEAMGQLRTEVYVWCTLKNIGKGPAMNIKAQIEQDIGSAEEVLGTLSLGDEEERKPFTIRKANGEYYLEVHYQDVYGRTFFSRRAVTFDQGDPRVGALETGERGPP